jgi:hypothetical protein
LYAGASACNASSREEFHVAIVSVIGVRIRDYIGGEKSLPLYILGTTSLADIQTAVNAFLADLDPVIDGKIEEAVVTIGLTLPGGLKSSPVAGKDVHNGALLSYDAANTNYRFSPYIPSWEEAGFTGDTVLTTGDYGTLEGEIAALFTDKDGNVLDSFISGKRVRRK